MVLTKFLYSLYKEEEMDSMAELEITKQIKSLEFQIFCYRQLLRTILPAVQDEVISSIIERFLDAEEEKSLEAKLIDLVVKPEEMS